MSLTGGIAVFFIIWWVVLFAVLPWGVRSHHEAGIVDPLAEAGSPLKPRLGLKAIITTIIAGIVFAIVYAVIEYRLIDLDAFPI